MSKKNKIIYWIATLWLALGMVSTGLVQLIKMKEEVKDGRGGIVVTFGLHMILLNWNALVQVVALVQKREAAMTHLGLKIGRL